MLDGEVVNSHIKVTEDTTVAKLSVFDQLKLLINKFNNNDVAELKAQETLSSVALTHKASLQRLFLGATKDFENGKHDSVTVSVSSEYIPYLDEVINPKYGLGRYFDFIVHKHELPPSIKYNFLVEIRRKVT